MRKSSSLLLAFAVSAGLALADNAANLGILRQLRFSPDGKYLLAQDDSEITVLAADPLGVLFRVQAHKGVLGHFTPDSQELVFVKAMTPVVQGQIQGPEGTPRVERWRISDRARVASTAIPSLTCGTASLAPDGRTLACDDLKGTLHVIDVTSGEETLTKKKFSLPGTDSRRANLWAADFEFSPDGRLLIALPNDDGVAVLWDAGGRNLLKSQGEVKLLSKAMFRSDFFAFLAPDRLAIMRARWISSKEGSKCTADVVAFPSGDVMSTMDMPHCPGGPSLEVGRPQRPFRRAADSSLLMIDYEVVIDRGVAGIINADSSLPRDWVWLQGRKARVETCAVEAKTGRVIQSDSRMLDVFANRYLTEVRPGEVGLWETGKGLLASIAVIKK